MVECIQRGSETHYFSYISYPEELSALAHGAAQGGLSELQGGKFIHGFISASLGSISTSAMTGLKIDHLGLQVSVSSAVGGTSSALTGGSFANGAVTGAFTVIYNHEMHDKPEIETKKETVVDEMGTGLTVIKRRDFALLMLKTCSDYAGVEVSMFLLDDGSFVILPWESLGNTEYTSYNGSFIIQKEGKSHFKMTSGMPGPKIMAQYHYGGDIEGRITTGSRSDCLFSIIHNVPVYHISTDKTYIFRPGNYEFLDNIGATPTISSSDFFEAKGKTIYYERPCLSR